MSETANFLLGKLLNGAATPDPQQSFNPAYGAQYLTSNDNPAIKQAGWVGADGRPLSSDIADHLNSLQPSDQLKFTSNPYNRPGFFGRMTDVGQQMVMADANALPYYGQQASQQAAAQRGVVGMSRAKTLGDIGSATMVNNQSPSLIASMAGQGTFNPENYQRAWQTMNDLSSNVVPARTSETLAGIGANTALANSVAAQHPAAANPNIAQAAINTAQVGAGTTGAQLQALPSTQANIIRQETIGTPYTQYAQEWQATHPFAGGGALRTPLLNPNTGVNSSIPNPSMSLQGLMFNPNGPLGGSFGGTAGGMVGPTSKATNLPPLDNTPSISQSYMPTIGNKLPDSFGRKVVPVEDYPDFDVDYSTGRLYYKGQDVTKDPRVSHVRQSASNQFVQEHQAKQDQRKATIASLKAERSALQAQYTTPWNEFINAPYGPWPIAKAIGRGIYNAPSNLIGYLSE